MATAFLSIGSNIDARRNVSAALALLQERFGPVRVSTVYQCPAVGFDGDDFYNLAAAFDSELPAAQLDQRLKAIEHELGRRRGAARYSDRPIDIDLVIYGEHASGGDAMSLPREDVLTRAFILRPLAEIAPDFVHPRAQRTLAVLWQEMSKRDDGGLVPVKLTPGGA